MTTRLPALALSLALAAVITSESATAIAAPIELVDKRRNYWIYDDVDGAVEHANWFNREPFFVGFRAIEDGYLATHDDDSQFLIVYSTFSLVQGVGAFFQSLENDVHGIGYDHAAAIDAIIPAPYFDDTPNSQIFGFMHMNDWHNFLLPGLTGLDETWISLVFGQELGHAWLSFVRFLDQGAPSTSMLGRALAHWSFYLHTGGSPVQGHDWTDNGDGTFTATKHDTFQYSDLDLYLMGLMGADEVEPWFLIEDPHECVDSNLEGMECASADAFLFKADSYTVSGTRRDLSIKDVIEFEGERTPAFPDAPNNFDVSFLLIKRPGEVLCDDELEAIEAVIERSLEMWVDQTRGRATLTNKTESAAARPGVACVPMDTTTGGETTTTTSGETSDTAGTSGTTDASTTSASPSEGTSGDASSATASGGELDPVGCACRSGDAGSGGGDPAALGLLGLLGLGAAGRRRHRHRRRGA